MFFFSKYLEQFVNGNLPTPQENSVEEKIFVLKKVFMQSMKITKKHSEIQSTIIGAISVKSNNQHSNSVNQANFSLTS